MPVNVSLDLLDEEALVRILTEPRSAIVKQYQRLFEMDNVRLEFTEGAIRAIAKKAIERKTGARGLRAIMESVMMDLMYTIPSETSVTECLITEETVTLGDAPLITYGERGQAKQAGGKKLSKKNGGEIA